MIATIGADAERRRSWDAWRIPITVAILVFGLVLLRQPHAILRPQFVWEETAAFWAASFTQHPLAYLVEPWAGYFQVLPRAVFLMARVAPPEVAPAVTLTFHAVFISMVALVMASDRMRTIFPDRRVQLTLAVGISVLPMAEPYVSVLSVQWFLALYLACLSLVPARRIDYPLVVLAGMSGVGAVLAAPLFFTSWRPGRPLDRRGLVLVVVAMGQGIVVLASGRGPRSPELLPIAVGALAIGGLALVAGARLPVGTRVAFGSLAIVTLALGVIAMGLSGRYLLAASAFAVLVAAALLVRRRPAGIAIASILLALMLSAFPIPPVADSDWARQAHCIGGSDPCLVTVTPVEWSVDWSLAWEPPTGMDHQGMPLP